MVTIFDMVTGEVIADEATTAHAFAAASCDGAQHTLLAPRLQTVQETRIDAARQTLPADLTRVSASVFVASQHG